MKVPEFGSAKAPVRTEVVLNQVSGILPFFSLSQGPPEFPFLGLDSVKISRIEENQIAICGIEVKKFGGVRPVACEYDRIFRSGSLKDFSEEPFLARWLPAEIHRAAPERIPHQEHTQSADRKMDLRA